MTRVALDAKKFSDDGVLPLRGFLPRKLVAAAQSAISSELTRLKIKANGKLTASKIQALPVFQQTIRLGQMIKVGDEIDRLFPEELLVAMNSLAGAPLERSPHPQILLSLPHKEAWSLDHLNWHLDLTPPKADQIPGVQAFVLIDDVQPRGGATLALAGSHKLHYVDREHNAHGILRQNSDFVSAPEKFLEPRTVHGARVQIVEMSGRAGDVYLMDLRVLHSPSINTRKDIRMMATNRFLLG
ncbi:phytanoyl-CoA dioxygenase family protein [Polyangium aurulentum]|uniref:phytanoyl-CoA dioxygenase family protein n=1 Tax=Polyangium aurulentum TaxID=2567896 RepID=UPI0010ADB045|nr:phytanoyl-CoA dioxygenase family protein [Polyangium aurulentum]UQA57878.1 phytanoyl-CoA dioxygenase family protein [Polyangium aurulentum]